MAKPAKLRIKEKVTEKEQAIEKFTDILNFFHDNGSTIEDFKYKFSAWSKAFISENKSNESLKSQAIVHLKLSRISRVLIIAIVSVCVLETYTKFQKSFAYLGLTLYLSVIVMNLVSNIIIAYRNSENKYISEVNQYFVSVYAMFQLFKIRLDVLQRRCNWDVKSDLVSSGDEPDYSNQDTDYGRLYSSAFHLYNIYGIVIGFIIFLLCFYLEFEIFASLEVFTFCLLFAIAIAKDIKFHKLHGRLQKSTKFMRNVTIEFLTWFENDCEICKILQQHQVSNTVSNLFLTRTLNICRKPRYLNFAISITTCKVFTGLNVSRNDFKNALMFLAYGKYFVLDKLTVKTINTQVVKQPCKEEKTAKEKYKLSCSHALVRNFDHSREIPECTEINRCRAADDNTKQVYSENKSNVHFANEDSEIDSKHINKKGTSTPPKYTGKASKVSFSNNKTDEALNPETKGRSFDESLPLRYELRKIEPEEEAESTSETHFSDIDEMDAESICKCKLHIVHNRGKPYNGVLCCKQCLNIINPTEVLSPISAKELRQIKIDYDDGSEKSCSNFEEISKKSICSGTFDADDIGEQFFNGFLLCKRCFDIVNRNSTHCAMSENELCQTKEEPAESVTKHLTKVSEEYCNTDDLFISEYKDTDLKTNGHKTNKSATYNFNKSVVISHDEHSCDSTSNTSTAETANFNELVASDFSKINDSNLHEQRTNEIKFKHESETINKDLSLNLNGNKPVKVSVKCFMTDDTDNFNKSVDNSHDEHSCDSTSNTSTAETANFNELVASDFSKINDSNLHEQRTNEIKFKEESETINKDLSLNLNGNKPVKVSVKCFMTDDTDNFNKSVDNSHDEHSCDSTSNTSTAETADFNELVASDFSKINDSNLHEQRTNEIKFKDESETINKDLSLNLNGNKPVKVSVKCFMTDDACSSGHASGHRLIETKHQTDENEMLKRQFHEGNSSDKPERLTQNNSTDKTSNTFVSDHQFKGVCMNLSEKSETHSNSGKPFESSFSGNSESDSNKQNKNRFAGEYNETQIPCDEINYERLINNLAYATENYPSGSNSFQNEIGDSGFFEPGGTETKSDIEYRIIEEDKIEVKHSNAPAEGTDNVHVTSNTIEKTEVHSNQNETFEKIFNENRKSYLHKQKLSETKLMDMDAHDITTKKIVVDNISNNPNTNTDKDILNHNVCISENDSIFLKNGFKNYLDENEILKDTSYFNRQSTIEAGSNDESYVHENTTIDNSSYYPVDSGFINVNQNIKSRTAISSINKSNYENVITNLANETETYLNNSETSDDITVTNKSVDFNQKPACETQLNGEFGITPKTIMELGINRTGEIDTSSNFKDIYENQNEQETEKREENVDKNIDGIINDDMSNELLSKVNIKEDQNDKIDKERKACNQRKNSKNKHNRKRSQKKRHLKSRNKETIDRFTDKITDSATALDHVGDTMEAFPNESTDLERRELMPNGSKNFSLLNETDKTSVGIVDETSEQLKHVNVTKTFQEVQDSSLQEDFNELVTNLTNHDKIDTASEIYQNNLILNQEDTDKLNDSITNADCYFDTQNVAHEANYPEINSPLSQEIDSPVSDKELAWTMMEQENFKQAFGSEQKSNIMEIPYCETNNKIEITSSDTKTIFATPSFAIEPIKNGNKCIIFTDETVHTENELTNVSKTGNKILYATNTVAPSESETVTSIEKMATDNSRSKSCFPGTSARIIKKGRRRVHGKLKSEKHTNCVTLESSAGGVFSAKTSTEGENKNRLIVDKEETNCVCLESSAGSVFNANTSIEEENRNRLVADEEQTNCVSLESSVGNVVNAKIITEEESRNKIIVDKELINCNKEQTNYVNLESSAESVSNPKINTKEENRVSTVTVNIHSLNEMKIQLAEQLPLESGDTESEISFSEKSSSQKLAEDNHRIRSPRNINDEVQNRSNELATNTAGSSNSQCNHGTRYPSNINDEVENKINESATNTVETYNSFTYKESELADKCTTNPEIGHNQLNTEEQSFATVASNIENDAKTSKYNVTVHARNTLTRLWKNEKNKMFEIFPKYRNAVKRKIIHMEKELRRNDQSCVRKLSVVDIKENKFTFQTADGDESFSSELEVTCKYPDDECEEIHEKRIRSWLQSVATENSSEISQKGLNGSKTPPTGSSEDSNFHFHKSTSPSDTSWDASGESGDTNSRHRSSACFSTNQESFECLEINKDKNTPLEKRVNRIGDSSDAEISKTHGGIKWVTMSSGGKPYTIPNRQPIISSSTSNELEQTTRNSKSNKITRESRNKISEIDNESELIFQKSGKFSYSAEACSTKKHLDSTPSDVQLNSETFEALAYNYDAEQNNPPKTKQTDPLKYHLIYKNLELHVLDSSPSLTIRLVDENDDNDAALTPRWKHFVNSSFSSSNSSIHELQLPSEMSSSSSGETVKENINISEGELKMLVGKSDHEEASVSSDSCKNLINKNSMENIAEVTVIKDSDILMNSGNADKVNQNKENQSAASEFHESESFVNKHALNESIIDKNDDPGGYNETVMKETGVVRTCSFENTDVRDNGNLVDHTSADKVSEEKNKEIQSVMHEFSESEKITNKNIMNESFVGNNGLPDGNIENLVKETEVIAICSAENIDVRDNGNLIDIENSDKVSQHKNKGDQSTMFEFYESKHFVNKPPISESVEIGDHVLGRNTETIVKETRVLASASFDKDCDEVSDLWDNDNLIDSESADKVSQQKNKGDRVAKYEFHESENFANKHRIYKSSLENNDVPAVNIETAVKETGVIASCSSDNISSEQYSVGNEISKTDANNVTDKNINEPVINDSYVPGGNIETVVKETEVVSSCSFQKNHNNSAGQYLVGNEISETDANNVSDTNVNPAGISENVSGDTETEVTTANKFSKDFQFETNGIKLTCKPSSECDSVEVKFRKLEDKTKLTFKSGYKKLYLKMSSKT